VRCCRCRCVVKEEEEDDAFFEKALQQNKTKGLTPSKNSKFLQDFGV
jgi:hypothetical protein